MNHTKVLGITIPSTLQWNCHIPGVIKKANKQMFFLILLKCAKVMTCDFISFYHTCSIRVLCTLKFIPPCIACVLSNDLEGIQKRALSIISPGLRYVDNLTLYNMSSLTDRRIERCNNLFELVVHCI